MVLKRMFRCKPFVKVLNGGVKVRGDETDICRMMIACVLALDNMSWDTRDLRKAIVSLKRIIGDDTNAEDT